jgi:hypothetical protein
VTRTERVAATRWILPAVLLMLVLPLYVGLLPWAFDDAYIHLRIAENLAAGEGPYYNPGQVVNASSAPAWTLVLAALSILGSTTLWIACFNAIVTVIGATVFVGLIKDLGNRPPNPVLAWSFALAAFGPPAVRHGALAIGWAALVSGRPCPDGLETSFESCVGYPGWLAQLAIRDALGGMPVSPASAMTALS